jgi:hypothetical protein
MNKAKYTVEGTVTDEQGKPVAGACLSIGGAIVYTDSQGAFLVRERKPDVLPIIVLDSGPRRTWQVACD